MPAKKSQRRGRKADPYRDREARKYENPIPSREYILELLDAHGVPLCFDEIAPLLEIDDPERLDALGRRLRAMERDGQLICNRRGGYCRVNRTDLHAGRVIGHPDGFGFLRPDDGGEDIFLSPREMHGLFHGDRAVIRVTGLDRRGRPEGSVVEVVERNTPRVVGRLHTEGGVGFVVPDNRRISLDIIVPRTELGAARQGQIVVVEIIEQPTRRTQPVGRVVEVIGDHMAPGMETDIAIRTHNLPDAWPAEVETQAARFGAEVPEAAKQGRSDLRALPLVTIDGEDARDFDDAVFCQRRPKGWRLLVAIADVSAYVEPGSPLDREARERGNSVYFPDRVIPMLPEALSNGLCSLNPQVDRLCMVCELSINDQGEVTRSRFFEAVMRSHARLTYSEVAAMLVDGDGRLCEQYAELLPHLHQLYQLYRCLAAARYRRGAIDFDTIETRFRFDAGGKVEEVVPLVRNDAHRLIEECMLVANVAAARLFQRKKLPALYRVHEGPTSEKLQDLKAFLAEFGLHLGGGAKPSALDYARLLEAIEGRPEAHLIQTVMLRSMAQAIYSPDNQGHFGLAFPAYTHFTSPIRRYPDLIVHRGLKHLVAGGGAADFDYSPADLQGLGEHCSSTERRADEAVRDATDWLKCEFMLDKVGESFNGVVASVNSFGLFVELEAIYVTGLIHITSLHKDFYRFDPVGHRLVGERTGSVFRLGDPIRIKVAAVNLDDRKIDFVPDEPAVAGRPRGRRRSRRR